MIVEFAEWLPDQPDFRNPGALEAKNVVPFANSYGQLNGLSAYSDALDSKCLGAIAARDKDGNRRVYAGDSAKLYELADAAFTDSSKVGGYSTGADEHWEMVKWGETVIATNFTDSPQTITMGGTNFADLTTALRGRHIDVVRDFVVMGNTYDATDGNVPHRVRWSAINDPTDWTVSAATQSDYQDLQGDGGWVQAIAGGEYGLVFQERSIWRMTYVGGAVVFQFDEIEPELGTYAPRSVARFKRFTFFLGQDGFYMMTDGTTSRNIGTEKVNRTFFNDLDESYYENITCVLDTANQLVYWSYPGAGHTGGEPNRVIIYNWATDRWSNADLDIQFFVKASTEGYTMEGLDSLTSDLDTLTDSLDSRVWTGTSYELAAFDSSNKLATFSGAALTATIDTKEGQVNPGHRTLIDSVRTIIDGGTSTVAIGTRNKLEDSVVWSSARSLNDIGEANHRENARYHRARVSITGGFNAAQGVEIVGPRTGRR